STNLQRLPRPDRRQQQADHSEQPRRAAVPSWRRLSPLPRLGGLEWLAADNKPPGYGGIAPPQFLRSASSHSMSVCPWFRRSFGLRIAYSLLNRPLTKIPWLFAHLMRRVRERLNRR